MTYIALPPAAVGTVTIDPQTVIGVTGTFWQATQPVSIASLPALATGANVIGSIANTGFTAAQSGIWNVGITNSSIPVTGTFWQATQPVSFGAIPSGANVIGSIANTAFIANAGTDLNTSALALEAGGNLEAIRDRLPTSIGPKVSGQSLSITPGTGSTFVLGAGSATVGTVNVAGTVSVTLPDAPLTDAQLRTAPVPVSLTTGSSAIGSITNTSFAATQSGTWNVGITGTPLVNLGTGGSAVSQVNPAFVRLSDGINPLGINSNPLFTTIANSSIAVTGTFWQATQPVSVATLPALATGGNVIGSIANTSFAATQSGAWNVGLTGTPTIIANAGTDLNTSALALESGGNLASIATNIGFINSKLPSLGQNAGSLSIPVVLPVSQIVTLTPPTAIRITNGSVNTSIFNLTNSNSLVTAIVDANGDQITSFGGGTQYSTGTAAATPTGTIALGHDGANVRALLTDVTGKLQTNIAGTLPAFAATPTFNIGTTPTLGVQGVAAARPIAIGGTEVITLIDSAFTPTISAPINLTNALRHFTVQLQVVSGTLTSINTEIQVSLFNGGWQTLTTSTNVTNGALELLDNYSCTWIRINITSLVGNSAVVSYYLAGSV